MALKSKRPLEKKDSTGSSHNDSESDLQTGEKRKAVTADEAFSAGPRGKKESHEAKINLEDLDSEGRRAFFEHIQSWSDVPVPKSEGEDDEEEQTGTVFYGLEEIARGKYTARVQELKPAE